jgi:PhnB protein
MAKTSTKSKPKAAAKARAQESGSHMARMPGITPHLVVAGAAKAIEFYKKAFGAKELMRLEGPDGLMWHACVEIAGHPVMLVDEFPQMGSVSPKGLKGTPVTIHVTVPDADAFAARAVAAGAILKMPVDDAFWGDRYGQVEDPFGHRWSIATHVRDMTIEEIKAAMPDLSECGDAAKPAS